MVFCWRIFGSRKIRYRLMARFLYSGNPETSDEIIPGDDTCVISTRLSLVLRAGRNVNGWSFSRGAGYMAVKVQVKDGGVTAATGFVAGGVKAGIKASGGADLALV
jgi:hypothetical protein